jgi:hypothetical protein
MSFAHQIKTRAGVFRNEAGARQTAENELRHQMCEDNRSFPWLLVLMSIPVVLIVAFLAFPSLWVYLTVFFSVNQIKRQEAKMQSAEFSSQVGHSLAVYCQSGSVIFPTGFVGNAWLPKQVRDLHPSSTRITESNVDIMMGGGFYHYGYYLERLPNSAPDSNFWKLTLYREGSDPKVVSTFSTAPSEKISVSNFVANTLLEYDKLSRSSKDDYDVRWLEQNRVAFLLQFDRAKVRDACIQASRDFPKRWWPRLTLAIVDSATGNENQAANEFAAWVGSNPSYSRYIYLAYYYEAMEKPDLAAVAIEKAITYSIIDLDDDDSNTECRGYWAGVYAFRSGKYGTVIKLCDALQPVQINGDYAKAALRDLRQAAVAAQSGTVPAFEPSQQVLKFNPYEHIGLEALRAH